MNKIATFVFIVFSLSLWSFDEPEKYIPTIVSPPNDLHIPLPEHLNDAALEIDFLISIRQKEKENKMVDGDYRRLFNLANEKINHFITQMEIEKANGYHGSRKQALRNYKKEIEAKFLNHTLTVNTLIILGIKLCFYADFCRVNFPDDLKAREALTHMGDLNLHNLFSTNAIKRMRKEKDYSPLSSLSFIASRTFEEIEECMYHSPIIPLISENGLFGINTSLYALAKGFVIVGLPVNNTSSAHSGMTRSFKTLYEYISLLRNEDKKDCDDLTFNSSLVGLKHDLVHLNDIKDMINPLQQYYEFFEQHNQKIPNYDNTSAIASARSVVECYRKIYLQLMLEWSELKNPEALSLFVYWLYHEHVYGVRDGSFLSPSEKIDAKLLPENRREGILINKKAYQWSGLSEQEIERRIKQEIIINEFDFAHDLRKLGFAVPINEENPYETIAAMREAFHEVYNQSPTIKDLLDRIREKEVHCFGVPFECMELTNGWLFTY